MGSFLSLAGTTTIIVMVVVAVLAGLHELRERVLNRRAKNATNFLLAKTKEYYFYGYSLAECLQVGMADELRCRDVGDFTKQLGALVLCALKESADPPIMYYRWYKKSEGVVEHYAAIVRFAHGERWWEFSLGERLDFTKLRQIKPNYVESRLSGEWERLDYWQLDRHKRRILDGCTDPKTSRLMPDLQCVRTTSRAEYIQLVCQEVDKVMDFWYFVNEQLNPHLVESVPEEGDTIE